MTSPIIQWQREAICLKGEAKAVPSFAPEIYSQVCRMGFDAPGFCLLNVGSRIDSVSFRQTMVDLKNALQAIHESRFDETLIYLSAARFDQQETTKPHLDAGPDECFLMLGYEPSEVSAELELVDYAKCAFDLGMTPKELLDKHNPMFQSGYDLLRPYATRVPCFSQTDYRIVCINNSSAAYAPDQSHWQGVLHTANILSPRRSETTGRKLDHDCHS